MSRISNIIIKKHTKVRRKMSDWIVFLDIPGQPAYGNKYPVNPTEVTDITRVAKGSRSLQISFLADHVKELFDEATTTINDRTWLMNEETYNEILEPKTPSWWERLRGRK